MVRNGIFSFIYRLADKHLLVIEDFSRLLIDAVLYYPFELISSSLFPPIFYASLH